MTVDEFVQSQIAPQHHALVAALRALVRECAPDAVEAVSYNMPVWKGRKIFAYITANQKGITLGFVYGVRLVDRHGLLRGTAKWARHLKLKDDRALPVEAVRDYVQQALAIDREGMPDDESE